MSKLYSRNILPSSIIVSGYNVYSVDSSSIEMVDVQNDILEKYKSFKYVVNNTSYYYVVDGIHTNWVSDLSSIGYSEVPFVVLPTVVKRSDIYSNPDSWNHQIGNGSEKFVYELVNGSYRGILYDDTTIKQCIYGWMYYTSGMSGWERHYYGVSTVKMSGNGLGVRNDTQNTINVTYLLYATCSDSTATVVTVYDSSNNPYNAFKYTTDGTDYYYYVLDGTQTDWTDDLSSIGYSLTKTYLRGWFNQNKTDQYISYTSRYVLYDDDGNTIPASSDAANYWGVAKCRSDGTVVSSNYFRGFESSNGVLRWYNSDGGTTVAYLLYSHTQP